ncbi:MAG: hypothetical protein L0Z50_22065 [Verrucomicrobiales bacterium]|nr:hypothetical protein [Verrucomicrobiales bacterium]
MKIELSFRNLILFFSASLLIVATQAADSVPILSVIQQPNAAMRVSWTNGVTGFALEETSSLSNSSFWQPVRVLLLAVLATGTCFAALRLRQERDRTRAHLWRSSLDQARSLRESDRVGRRAAALEAVERAARIRRSIEVRNETIAALPLTEFSVRKQWAGFPEGTVTVAIDPEHQFYARCNEQGRISVREVASDQEMASLDGPPRMCVRMQFSPGSRYLAAGFFAPADNQMNEVRVWEWRADTAPRTQILKLYTDSPGYFDFHPGSDFWAFRSSGKRRAIEHFALPSGALQSSHPVDYRVGCMRFSPDGRFLAVEFDQHPTGETWDSCLSVFDAREYRLLHSFPGGTRVRTLCWHPNSQWLFVARNTAKLDSYDAIQGKTLGIRARHEMPVDSCAFDSNGERLATVTYDGTVSVWNMARERVLFSTQTQGGELSFAADNAQLALGIEPPMLQLWGIEPSKFCERIPNTAHYHRTLDFSPDGSLLIAASPFAGVTFCDLARNRVAAVHAVPGISSAFFDSTGERLITIGHPGLEVWPVRWDRPSNEVSSENAASNRVIRIGPVERRAVPASLPLENGTIGPDGQIVAIEAGFRDVMLGDFSSTPPSWETIGTDGAGALSFSHNGRWFAMVPGRYAAIRVLEVRTRGVVLDHRASQGSVQSLRFSRDDRWLEVATDQEYLVWETGSWKLARRIPNRGRHEPSAPADFSPDGRVLAIVWQGRFIRLLKAEDGTELATLVPPDSSSLIHLLRFNHHSQFRAQEVHFHLPVVVERNWQLGI